jgi:hypothetical protein
MLKIFVVFHKKIFDECYENVSQDILDKYFTFVAVNPDIPKTYTKDKYNVINEWELEHYNADFQKKGYNENSVIYHIKANKLHENYKYIGFFQYDMIFTDAAVNTVLNEMNSKATCFYLSVHNYKYCAYDTCNEYHTMKYLSNSYTMFFNREFTHSEEDIYPLFNSYVIPVDIYEKLMEWVVTLYSEIEPMLYQKHFGHIGGIFERVMAFAVGEEKLHLTPIEVKHDHMYKNSLSEV